MSFQVSDMYYVFFPRESLRIYTKILEFSPLHVLLSLLAPTVLKSKPWSCKHSHISLMSIASLFGVSLAVLPVKEVHNSLKFFFLLFSFV